MNKPFHYYCKVTYGNVSVFETKNQDKRLRAFLDCFFVKDYSIEKVDDEIPYYIAKISFTSFQERKRQHFINAIFAFALYRGMGFSE